MPIQDHPIHIKPDEGLVLWRYISFPKYQSLLKECALFFCRADKFSDPFECAIPRREAEYRISEHNFRMTEAVFGRYDSVFDEAKAKKQSQDMADTHKKVKYATTVNCWHINSHESDAMWQLYLKNNEGVAIKTTVRHLTNALAEVKQNIGISKVRYIDYENGIWFHETEYPAAKHYNLLIPLIHKRREFTHESELRLYHHDHTREKAGYWESLESQIGELIPIDIKQLVQTVVFHPTADDTIKKKIIDVSCEYGYNFKFEDSKMTNKPIY
ncbi:MAG: DUF2971 domain-containing protein [Bacteroidia bacterium]|jgi:hypothetical protein|nr:DUF2971 domain-containing protein [Bacteroidia bacterium]